MEVPQRAQRVAGQAVGAHPALNEEGIDVEEVVPIPISPHLRNLNYLRAKHERLGHISPAGAAIEDGTGEAVDVSTLLGEFRAPSWRPCVVLKHAQTLDGRIATASDDSKGMSGEPERRISHALRAACDAVPSAVRA